MSDRTVYAWGYNGYCQLGDGTKTTRYSPVDIGWNTGYDIVGVSTDSIETHVVTADGAVMSWGDNNYGQVISIPSLLKPAPQRSLSLARDSVTPDA